MPKVAKPTELSEEQVSLLQQWSEVKSALSAVKSDEMTKRLAVIDQMPFDGAKQEGSQTIKLGAGWSLKLDRSIGYTADKDPQIVVAALGKLAETNPGAAQELVRWEAVISTAAYKKLTDEEKLIVASVVTVKPGAPSLSLNPPAAKKD